MKKLLCVLSLLLILSGCTDASREKLFSFGSERSIKCYSGGKLIYSGISSGKISSERNSDGYYFKDKNTNRLMEVSGDCVMQL